LHRQVRRFLSPDNSAGVDAGLEIRIRKGGSLTHKPPPGRKITHRINCRHCVACRERDDLFATGYEGWIAADNKRTGALLGHGRECCVDLAFGTSSQDNELEPKGTRSGLRISQLSLGTRKIWIQQCRDYGDAGKKFA